MGPVQEEATKVITRNKLTSSSKRFIKTKYHLGTETAKCKIIIHSFLKKKKKKIKRYNQVLSLKASRSLWAQTVYKTSKVPTL